GRLKSFLSHFDRLEGRDAYLLLMFWSVRTVFILITNPGFQMPDTGRYIRLSDAVLRGDFNFDDGMFIVAPLYPFFVAIHKAIFGAFWTPALITTQILLDGLAGLTLYRLAKLLFVGPAAAALTAVLYALNPSTMWFSPTIGQEALFMSLLIFAVYYLVKSLKTGRTRHTLYSALLYSGAFLTKSHVLLFSPFIVLTYLFSRLERRRRWTFSALYAGLCLAATLPFGMVNLRLHGVYTLSSNGYQAHFYIGNTEYAYQFFLNTPPLSDSFCLLEIRSFPYGFVRYNGEEHLEILSRPQAEKQTLFLKAALRWIAENPVKFVKLKLYYAYAFLTPGLDFHHHPFERWLTAFLLGLPIFVFAYWGMFLSLKRDVSTHFWILGLFLAMTVFSVGFYVQNRFRRCTIEPFYLVYAAYGATEAFNRLRGRTTAEKRESVRAPSLRSSENTAVMEAVGTDGR
ncbi:MAG: glycosyltransferase family 39 protein, partial [Bacteroidia bacterium]|nr:glycosyltransferase family 39 protein [Bacteroidia bacterium]